MPAQTYLPILCANMTQLIIYQIQMGLHKLGEHSFVFLTPTVTCNMEVFFRTKL
jgi:hypothetical protein